MRLPFRRLYCLSLGLGILGAWEMGVAHASVPSCSSKTFKNGSYFVFKTGPFHPQRVVDGKKYSADTRSLGDVEFWKTKVDVNGKKLDLYVDCGTLRMKKNPKRDRRSHELRFDLASSPGCKVIGPVRMSDLDALMAGPNGCSLGSDLDQSKKQAKKVISAVREDNKKYWGPYFDRFRKKKIVAVPAVDPEKEAGVGDKIESCNPVKDSDLYKINLKSAVGEQCDFKPAEMGMKTLCAFPAECKRGSEEAYASTITCLSNEKGECPAFDACRAATDLEVNVRVSVAGRVEAAASAVEEKKAAGATEVKEEK